MIGDRLRFALWATLIVAIVAGLWGVRVFADGKSHWSTQDIFLYHFPLYDYFYTHLASGKLVLWNPYQLCGVPTVATLQGGYFYPPHLLYLFLPTNYGLAALGLLHLLLIGISTQLFLRRLGLHPLAASAGGVLCAAAPAFHQQLLIPNFLEAASWLPLGALAALELARAPSKRCFVGLALVVAMSLLAGFPQALVYNGYVWGWVFLIQLAIADTKGREKALALLCFAGAIVFASLLAAVQLVPTFELAESGLRNLGQLEMRDIHPFRWVSGWGHLPGISQYLAPTSAALMLACSWSRRHRITALSFFVLGSAAYLVSLGASFVFDFYLSLPLLGSFRAPQRISFVTDFCFSIVVALGADAILSQARSGSASSNWASRIPWRSWLLPIAALLLSIALFLPRVGLAGSMIALAVVATLSGLWLLRKSRWLPTLACALLCVGAIAEAWLREVPYWGLPYANPSYTERYARIPPILRDLAGRPERSWIYDPRGFPLIPPNAASGFGLRSIDAYEPFHTEWQRQYWNYFRDGDLEVRRGPGDTGRLNPREALVENRAASRHRLLDLAATRFVAVAVPIETFFAPFLSELELQSIGRSERGLRLEVFENHRALPRAYVTYDTEPAPPAAELLERLSRGDFDPRERSFVEAGRKLAAPPGIEVGREAGLLRDDEHVVEIEARLDASGMVVLADSYHPGWRASIDGEPAEVYRVNQMFRGVYAGAGTHQIRFEFEHSSFWVGAGISLTALAALVAILAWLPGRPAEPEAAGEA